MNPLAAVLAFFVGASSLTPFFARPATLAAKRERRHDCCCASCPGPGLCPCDPDSSRGSACVQASDDLPAQVETPPTPSSFKVACELPTRPAVPETGEGRAESDRAPHNRVVADRPEKVPISVT